MGGHTKKNKSSKSWQGLILQRRASSHGHLAALLQVNSRRSRSDGVQGVWSCLERVVRVDCLELVVRLLLHGSGPDWLLVSDPEVASFRGKTGRCCNHQPPILGQCTMCCLYSLFLSTKRSGTFLCCEAMYLHIFLHTHSVERKTGRCCNHQTKILENIVSCGYVQMH